MSSWIYKQEAGTTMDIPILIMYLLKNKGQTYFNYCAIGLFTQKQGVHASKNAQFTKLNIYQTICNGFIYSKKITMDVIIWKKKQRNI